METINHTDLFGQHLFLKGIINILCIVAAIALSVLAGTLLLCAVYSLPVDKIDQNVGKSAPTIEEEGPYPKLSEWCTSELDNYTDSLMLLEAADDSDGPILDNVMNMYHGIMEGKEPPQTLVDHYINGEEYDYVAPYPRYWHGFLVYLKPLLQIWDYNSIRIANGMLQLHLVEIICFMLVLKKMGFYIIPFLITYGMLMPAALAKSLQFSSCFYAFTTGIIALLLIKQEKLNKWARWVFLFIGISTAFFDFLTYPIATFGIPAAFCLALTESDTIGKRLGNLVRNGLFWVVGYGGMWASKWILAGKITGKDIIADGAKAAIRRTSDTGAFGVQITFIDSEIKNVVAFLRTPVTEVLIIYLICMLIMCLMNWRELSLKNVLRKAFPYLLVGLAPFVWYAVLKNHSHVHAYFTNKACSVSALAVCFALNSLSQKREERDVGS